jgi:hypothetical protein
MLQARMTSLRVAAPFALAAAVWAVVMAQVSPELHRIDYQYDYFLDLIFAAIIGLLLCRDRACSTDRYPMAADHASWSREIVLEITNCNVSTILSLF